MGNRPEEGRYSCYDTDTGTKWPIDRATNLIQISSKSLQVERDGGVQVSHDIRAEDPGREHEAAAECRGPKDAVAKVASRRNTVPPSCRM